MREKNLYKWPLEGVLLGESCKDGVGNKLLLELRRKFWSALSLEQDLMREGQSFCTLNYPSPIVHPSSVFPNRME